MPADPTEEKGDFAGPCALDEPIDENAMALGVAEDEPIDELGEDPAELRRF